MEKQTSIDWFIDKLPIRMKNYLREEIETVRKMHKEEIKEGYIMALLDRDNKIRRDAEDYYNETYGGGKDE